jgi:hypothetical protein
MFDDEKRKIIEAVMEKKRLDRSYKPSPEEQEVIDSVLQSTVDKLHSTNKKPMKKSLAT